MRKGWRAYACLFVAATLAGILSGSCGSSDSSGTSDSGKVPDSGRMNATSTVYAEGAHLLNRNDFPWYGLVVTLNDRYSNRHLFGDPDRPHLRSDSVVEPGEFRTVTFADDFIDAQGVWWETVPNRLTVKRIKLEAKSRIDGSYDLSTTLSY